MHNKIYQVYIQGNKVAKLDAHGLKDWLLERKANVQAQNILRNVNNFGRYRSKEFVILRFTNFNKKVVV